MAASAAGTRASTESLSDRFAGDHVDPLAERAGELVERRAARSGKRDGRTLGMERAGNGAADAAGRAGDKGLACR